MFSVSSIFDPYANKQYTEEVNAEAMYSTAGDEAVPDFSSMLNNDISISQVNTLHGIFGIPYQFLSTVDPRPSDGMIGRKYNEKILSKSPLLFLTPVKQDFMSDFGQDDRNLITAVLAGGDTDLANGLSGSGKYYTTKFAYDTYYMTVNKMCSEVAYFLGIGDVEIGQIGENSTVPIKNIDWSKATNPSFKSYYAASKAVVMYLDGNSVATLSDSFNNGTTESSLASTINGYGEQARELKFLLGEGALSQLFEDNGAAKDNITQGLESVVGNLTGGMLADLASTGVNTVLSGGKMIFPKIWGDSQYNRSYSFDIKLRSPDHDKISIFLNILVPYIHLLGMVLPRSTESQNPNAFQSPLLVKAYCKGMFNIDMGMITDMSVNRGAECQWNDDGLPTQIDISLQIEDLYSSLMLTQLEQKGLWDTVIKRNWDVVSNTGMLNFLANMAGLNVADIELGVRQRLYIYLQASDLARAPSTAGSIVDNYLQNIYMRLTRKLYTP